jgi:hypothetical protein
MPWAEFFEFRKTVGKHVLLHLGQVTGNCQRKRYISINVQCTRRNEALCCDTAQLSWWETHHQYNLLKGAGSEHWLITR